MNTAKTETGPIQSSATRPTAGKPPGRRFADTIRPGGRNLKLDRRAQDRDRRVNMTQEYHGAPRRVTIDRRSNSQERRDTRLKTS